MNKFFFSLTLIMSSFASLLTADSGVEHLYDDTFAEATEQGVAIVDFYAEWCPPCRRFAPTFSELAEELQEESAEEGTISMTAYKVNVDEAPDTSVSQSVRAIPTIISYKYGEEVERRVGVQTLEELREMTHTALTFGDDE